jgi:hypothetical protein
MNEEFLDSYGLITDTKNAIERENSLLWTAQHFFLTRSPDTFTSLYNAIQTCRTGQGLYAQHPSHNMKGDDVYLSHDQLTAIMCFSYDQNMYMHKEIWAEIKRQKFTYNNTGDGTLQLLHPRDIIYYGILCGSWMWYLLLPLLLLTLFWSFRDFKIINGVKVPSTDGELLSFVRFACLKDKSKFWNLLWKVYYWDVRRRFGSYSAVFKIYFPFPDHPNVIESASL